MAIQNTYYIKARAAGGGSVGAKLLKTGVTTSYASNDDGDLEKGREVGWDTLPSNNPFGNTNRFTDELGGTSYTKNIVIDWTTYNGTDVLGYKRSLSNYVRWSDAISQGAATSITGFTSGWRCANIHELFNVVKFTGSYAFYWSPLNYPTTGNTWSSTTYGSSNAFYISGAGTRTMSYQSTGNRAYYIACRDFTVNGTTLT